MARDRMILSGASATRLLNKYRWEGAEVDIDVDTRLDAFFSSCRDYNKDKDIPVYSGLLETDIDFAIECRNTFNFYHFITESLSQLTLLDGLDFQGNIYFHFPNQEDKQRSFAEDFVKALFPEFEGRVFFERAPKDYKKVLTAFDLIGAHALMPVQDVAGIEKYASSDVVEEKGLSDVGLLATLAMNSVSSMILALRVRALKAIEGADFSHLPRRFYVGRDTRQSRSRHMEGEDLLFDHLKLFGFEYVVFENLSPLEQVALMANAEMMISYHGAGFTNMLFANPDAYVIEVGTLQTAQVRWGDFWPLANAAQCKYVNFFADFRADNPLIEPVFKEDGIIPVFLSEQGTAQLMSFVVTVLGLYPTLTGAASLADTARKVLQVGAGDHAVRLLEQHADLVRDNAQLCLLQADCHKQQDEPKSELIALDRAFKADPKRWQTLVRMIWCANRCKRPQVIRWALSRLKADFPQRHDAFLGNHEWVRYVA
ncbi:MAG: glycosyltransferase family 61 protein [Sulfitobacter sp.]